MWPEAGIKKGRTRESLPLHEFSWVAGWASNQEDFHAEKYKRRGYDGILRETKETGVGFLMLGVVHGRVAV
jgi:hypothetical protein